MRNRSNDTIEGRILETMVAFDRPDILPPDPRFYGRVTARLAREARPHGGFARLLKPALITVLALLNLATAFAVLGARGRLESERQRTAFAQALAADLNLTGETRPLFVEDRE